MKTFIKLLPSIAIIVLIISLISSKIQYKDLKRAEITYTMTSFEIGWRLGYNSGLRLSDSVSVTECFKKDSTNFYYDLYIEPSK